jgi:hypothetical protein
MSDRTRKLVSIRHRTDHDLTVLVNRELDRGLALVDVAATRTSPLFARAEKAYGTAKAILPRISDLSEGDRLRLESRLKELRVRLDQVATFARVERYTASVASKIPNGNATAGRRRNKCERIRCEGSTSPYAQTPLG